MIGTVGKIAIGLTCGGALTAGGVVMVVLTRQGDQLDIVERYGLLALHALVVLGLGGAMVRIGWKQVGVMSKISTTLEKLVVARKEDRESNDSERDEAVGVVKGVIEQSRDDILGALGRLRQDIAKGKGR